MIPRLVSCGFARIVFRNSSNGLTRSGGHPNCLRRCMRQDIRGRSPDIQTFKNPFGKINGDDVCIVSIKEVVDDSLACFRQVNDSDVLVLLELGDYRAIVKDTINMICREFPRISAVFSVNCLFRYKLFSENNYMQEYLREMSALGSHGGLVGYGEHYNNRFVNQSMTCVVFE